MEAGRQCCGRLAREANGRVMVKWLCRPFIRVNTAAHVLQLICKREGCEYYANSGASAAARSRVNSHCKLSSLRLHTPDRGSNNIAYCAMLFTTS